MAWKKQGMLGKGHVEGGMEGEGTVGEITYRENNACVQMLVYGNSLATQVGCGVHLEMESFERSLKLP